MVLPDWIINFLRKTGILKAPVSEQATLEERLRHLNQEQDKNYAEWLAYAKEVEELEKSVQNIPSSGAAAVLRTRGKHKMAELKKLIDNIVNLVNANNTEIHLLQTKLGLNTVSSIGEKIIQENVELQQTMIRAELALEGISEAQNTLAETGSEKFKVKDPTVEEEPVQPVSAAKVPVEETKNEKTVSEIDSGNV